VAYCHRGCYVDGWWKREIDLHIQTNDSNQPFYANHIRSSIVTYTIDDSGIWVCGFRVCLYLQESNDLSQEVEDDPETGFVFLCKFECQAQQYPWVFSFLYNQCSFHDSILKVSGTTDQGVTHHGSFFLACAAT
jgi:hypothetical protein